MNPVPRLLEGSRRVLAGLLAMLALGEAVLAVLFAAALDLLMVGDQVSPLALCAAASIAVMAAAALLLVRWLGERFAQHFVVDCRTALFKALTYQARNAKQADKDARWLTLLINDMAALRHYALRGTVRLWTSALAACAASAWVIATMPLLRPAMVPLLAGAGAILLLARSLSQAVAAQRHARGRLNRFLVRRVRAELAGAVSPRGHGFHKLAELSHHLARASVRRARSAGAMDAAATLGGLAAALILMWQATAAGGAGADQGLAGSLTLLGFISARLLDSARALHARIGGRLALARLARLFDADADEAIPVAP